MTKFPWIAIRYPCPGVHLPVRFIIKVLTPILSLRQSVTFWSPDWSHHSVLSLSAHRRPICKFAEMLHNSTRIRADSGVVDVVGGWSSRISAILKSASLRCLSQPPRNWGRTLCTAKSPKKYFDLVWLANFPFYAVWQQRGKKYIIWKQAEVKFQRRSQVRPAQRNLIKTRLALAYIRKYIT